MNARNRRYFFIASYIAFIACLLTIALLLLYCSQGIRATQSISTSTVQETVIIIDAGHGGEDGGTIGVNGCLEKDINLEIAKKLQTFLLSMGIKSVLTRTTDTLLYDRNEDYQGRKKHLDMLARLEIANSYQSAIFISIHQNAFPQEKYSGFQIYYSQNNEGSLTLAKTIEASVKQRLQPNNNRKAKLSGGSIYLLDKLNCPALLLECGFLSNAEECALLCSTEYQNKLCAVIASDIANFITQ